MHSSASSQDSNVMIHTMASAVLCQLVGYDGTLL